MYFSRVPDHYSFEFEINELPKTTNAQNSMHWTKKAKYVKEWHTRVLAAMGRSKPKKPLKRAKLTLARYSSVEPDFDGLVSSFKHVIDGLIVCGVIEDDKMSNIGGSNYLWIKAKRNSGKIFVSIEEISDG